MSPNRLQLRMLNEMHSVPRERAENVRDRSRQGSYDWTLGHTQKGHLVWSRLHRIPATCDVYKTVDFCSLDLAAFSSVRNGQLEQFLIILKVPF